MLRSLIYMFNIGNRQLYLSPLGHAYFGLDGEDRIESVANLEFLHYSAEPRTGVSLGGDSSTSTRGRGGLASYP